MKIPSYDAARFTAPSWAVGSAALSGVFDAAISGVFDKKLRGTCVAHFVPAPGMFPTQRGVLANIPGVRFWRPPV